MLKAVSQPQMMDFTKEKNRLLEIIRRKSLLTQGGPFKLASGAMSDYYLDLKPTALDPEGSALIADILFAMIRHDDDVDSIGGLELGAVPIVTAVCARSWPERPINAFVVRKENKGHGTDKKIDGNFKPDTTVILIEDVTTKGGSVMQAVDAVRARGCKVKRILTVVDRLEGAEVNLRKEGLELEAVFTSKDLLGR
jgi:orotate phosphoribosyltransferase